MFAIAADGLSKTLPTDVRGRRPVLLRDVSLHVPVGALHGLVGANGAGKSTTLRMVVGAARPSSGRVTLFDQPATTAAARVGLGFAPDVAVLPQTLSALEVLRLHAALGPGPDTIESVLHEVELSHRRHDPVGRYSKGMQQRASLAVALLGSPRLLVLDEPMSGLDPMGRELVRSILRARHAAGVTILFSSHVLADIADLCDTVTVIDAGRTVFEGALAGLAGDAQGHRVVFAAATGTVPAWAGPGTARIKDQRLFVEIGSDLELEQALATGRGLGLRVVTIESVRPRLEDRIVALMKGGSS
jgi:ABC-2 type transport system ATP-binding protein